CYLTQLWELDLSKVKIIGVTGTNGKTTTTWLVAQILQAWGKPCRVIGTINSSLTTPEPFSLLGILREMIQSGEQYLIMEVSSIGIAENRIAGLPFAVKCLTNITQDHLDYHKSFRAYVQAKMSFLRQSGTTIYPRDYKKIMIDFPLSLKGSFNRANAQAAYAIARELGVPNAVTQSALENATPPKGRFQLIETTLPFQVIVDYAHTPDGLINILRAARKLAQNKLIVVFGAGGNRDQTKRPLMGKAADTLADQIILTNDNPRHEDPQTILTAIHSGISRHQPLMILDRREAIAHALDIASTGDVVVIAGKGHETCQIIADTTLHFDDVQIAQGLLRSKEKEPHVQHR
ncbi:MAG: UDP-N-acetylmuramoyl-L-alanyl-D-glutamate--2,6-diaminopimelate ligase, partial [Candidatus Margulisiibacteriota bacterium]